MTDTAMTVHQGAIEPQNLAELRVLAKDAVASQFFGTKLLPEQALMILMSGRDLGLSYPQALRAFHIIDGKVSLSAQGMMAVCLKRKDVCVYFRTIESTSTSCTVETQRAGDPPRQVTFTEADAKLAGLWGKQNWAKYPRAMLLSRAQSALAREVYADILLGMYDEDETAEIAANERAREKRQVPMITVVAETRSAPDVDAASLLLAVRSALSPAALKLATGRIAAARDQLGEKVLLELREEVRTAHARLSGVPAARPTPTEPVEAEVGT